MHDRRDARVGHGQRGGGQARPMAPQSDVLGRWQTVPVGSGQQQGQQRERQRQHAVGPVDEKKDEKWGHDRFEAAQRARQSKHVRDYRDSLRDALKNFDYDS